MKQSKASADAVVDWSERIAAIEMEIESLASERKRIEVTRAETAKRIVHGDVTAREQLEHLGREIAGIGADLTNRGLELEAARQALAEQQATEAAEAERKRLERIRDLADEAAKCAGAVDAAALELHKALSAFEEKGREFAHLSGSQVLGRR